MDKKNPDKEKLWGMVAETIGRNFGAFASIITTDVTTQLFGFSDIEDFGIEDKDIKQLHKMLTEFIEKNIYKRKRRKYNKIIKEKLVKNREYIVRLLIVTLLTQYINRYYSDEDMHLLYSIQEYLNGNAIGIMVKRGTNNISVKVGSIEEDDYAKPTITDDTMFR